MKILKDSVMQVLKELATKGATEKLYLKKDRPGTESSLQIQVDAIRYKSRQNKEAN